MIRFCCLIFLAGFCVSLATAQPQPVDTVPLALQAPGDLAVETTTVAFAQDVEPALSFDLYRPVAKSRDAKLGLVVFVSGANNVRHWRWFQDLSRLAVADGFAALVPDKRYPRGWDGLVTGFDDTVRALKYIRDHADELGIDLARVCLWTISAGGRLTSAGLQAGDWRPRCLVNYYGLLDLDAELTGVADEARRTELANRYSPRHTFAALGADAPPFYVVRAGRDAAVINNSIDRLGADALVKNLPLTLVNLPDRVHGFDAWQHDATSRAAIAATFAFIRAQLNPDAAR